MLKYVGKRILWMIPVILGVSLVIMAIMEFTPGDPATIILGIEATDESKAALNEELGLDDPFVQRYCRFIYNAATKFDFGESYTSRDSIRDQILFRIPYTLRISVISLLIAICIGIPAGVLAATHQYSAKDNFTMFFSLFFVSMPNFWFALMMIMLFALKLGILPSLGVDHWTGYILPCVSVALGTTASLARQTRSSMLEVIRQDYITTARAKGQKESKVIYGHGLQNALMPIITVVVARFAHALGGSMVVESIFSIPGMGSYLINAINSRDYAVVQAGVFVISLWFGLCMLAMDLVYAAADPRIRSQYRSSR
ncbi:MAG: ABC transporter permease [Clostridiaceae bacterium]|nr:ABC transporter permease [Clostridiaceae bacterium]